MHVRLSTFWFLYMCGWGIFFPYYSLYLGQDLGLSESRVGIVMAIFPLVGMFAQPLWGQVADRTGSRRRVLAAISAGTAVACVGLVLLQGFGSAALGTALFAVFGIAVLPLATSVSLATVGRGGINRFGLIRMWGTMGFLAVVLLFPLFLERIAPAAPAGLPWDGLGWMFPAAAAFVLISSVFALALPETPALAERSERGDVSRLLRHAPVVRLLILAFAAHLFMQGAINLFPLYVRDRGGDAATVGRMWVFMLLLEIPLIAFSGTTLRRVGARGLLTIGLLAEGVRWTTSALAHDLTLIRAVQLLHGVGVAGIVIGAPLYLEQAVPGRLRSTAQAFVATVGFGAAAILSNTAFGFLMDRFGASVPYGVAGVGLLLLASAAYAFLPVPRPPSEEAW